MGARGGSGERELGSWERRVAAAAVAVLGASLVVGDYARGFDPSRAALHAVRLGAAAFLLVAGFSLFRADLDDDLALRVAAATVAGTFLLGAVGSGVTMTTGVDPLTASLHLEILDFAGLGGASGFVFGLLSARRTAAVRDVDRQTPPAPASAPAPAPDLDRDGSLLEDLPDAVVVHDTRGRVLAANRAARDRLGYDRSALSTRRLSAVETRPDGDPNRRRRDDGFDYDATYVAADGATLPVAVSARVVRYGDHPAVVSVARPRRDAPVDPTRVDRLERARDELAALDRVLRHDVRNDMQVVLGVVDLLSDHVDDEGRDLLDTVERTGNHLVDLTHRSGTVARAVLDGSANAHEPTPLAPTLREEIDSRRRTFEHARFVVSDLPDVDVVADDLLPSVFRNLLTNAVTHNDRPHPEVRVSARRTDDAVVVAVADDGPGIPDARKETVFERGERGAESDGSGLGLYLVATLVERYGGDVWVADNDPAGPSCRSDCRWRPDGGVDTRHSTLYHPRVRASARCGRCSPRRARSCFIRRPSSTATGRIPG